VVRAAAPGDAAAIAAVHVRAWRAGYAGLLPDELLDALSVERRTRDWSTRLGTGAAGLVLVAEQAGSVVGFANLLGGEITALYVDPERWRRGIGSELLRAALEAAGDRPAVTLWVLADNAASRGFYERFGFEPDGTEKREPIGPEGWKAEPLQIRLRLERG
jgi:ribosomal protein S18 acetylase RimI-like enzyme